MLDTQSLIKEVAARHAIRIYEDDPCFALVTLNEVVLSATAIQLQEEVRISIAEFEQAVQKVQVNAGRIVAQQVKEAINECRIELGSLGHGNVSAVQGRGHSVPNSGSFARSLVVSLLAGLGLFLGGIFVGQHYLR